MPYFLPARCKSRLMELSRGKGNGPASLSCTTLEGVTAVGTVVESQASVALLFGAIYKIGTRKGTGDSSFARDALTQAQKKLPSQVWNDLQDADNARRWLDERYIEIPGPDEGKSFWSLIHQYEVSSTENGIGQVLLVAEDTNSKVDSISSALQSFFSPGSLAVLAQHKAKQENLKQAKITKEKIKADKDAAATAALMKRKEDAAARKAAQEKKAAERQQNVKVTKHRPATKPFGSFQATTPDKKKKPSVFSRLMAPVERRRIPMKHQDDDIDDIDDDDNDDVGSLSSTTPTPPLTTNEAPLSEGSVIKMTPRTTIGTRKAAGTPLAGICLQNKFNSLLSLRSKGPKAAQSPETF